MLIIAIIVIFILMVFFYIVSGYNSLIRLRNQVKNAWSQIDVQLKRRYDLIPNLMETVKGYMKHEKETLENITAARSRAMDAGNMHDKLAAEGELTNAIGRFLLVVENYPDLKADQSFALLQEELTATENKISFSRQSYNDSVYLFNNKIEMFPTNVLAAFFSFTKEEFFEIENPTEKNVPKVSF